MGTFGRKLSEETKKKMSERMKGSKNFFYGKKHSPETRRKMREHHRGMTGKRMPKWFGKFISKTRRGKNNPNWGKTTSDHQKKMASMAHKREKNFNWKGGQISDNGYIRLLRPDHPFADKKGYVKRSRLVMESSIGRFLNPKEIVHHVNHIKTDDRIENLKLFSCNSEHMKFHKFHKN